MGDVKIISTPHGQRVRACIRVRLAETDAQGVVYYGNFFTYFEVGRLGLVRAAGFDLARPNLDGNFYIVTATCNYRSFARYYDQLTLETWIDRLGRSSVHFRHQLWVRDSEDAAAENRLCAEAHDTLVWLGSDLRPAPIPAPLRESLRPFLQRRALWSDGQPRHWQVVVGSDNPAKLDAVRQVLGRIDPTCHVSGLRVTSDLPKQPWGYEQTRSGAEERARRALLNTTADLGVGMETGLVERQGTVYVSCWCAVVDRNGWKSLASGAEMPLPHQIGRRLRPGDTETELGPIIDEVAGEAGAGRHLGAIGVLSRGLLTRQQSWEHALVYALTPLLAPGGGQGGDAGHVGRGSPVPV